MKRIIAICALLLITSCSVFGPSLSKGKYSCSTKYGTIGIELLASDVCVIYFEGCKEYQGSYRIEGDLVRIGGFARDWNESGKNRKWVTYSFSLLDESGKILDNDKFSVKANVTYGDNSSTETCVFVRRN